MLRGMNAKTGTEKRRGWGREVERGCHHNALSSVCCDDRLLAQECVSTLPLYVPRLRPHPASHASHPPAPIGAFCLLVDIVQSRPTLLVPLSPLSVMTVCLCACPLVSVHVCLSEFVKSLSLSSRCLSMSVVLSPPLPFNLTRTPRSTSCCCSTKVGSSSSFAV
jgi:hypothetical protein